MSASQVMCSICRKPVPLEAIQTDEEGNTVHEECLVRKMKAGFTAPHPPDTHGSRAA
jgi:hypothetical protein